MTYFYKAVQHAHILGQSLIPSERSKGIKGDGLDPAKRNASGGATVVAAAQSGRPLSSADASGVGQCLSGHMDYATDYASTSEHVVLRVNLSAGDLKMLVKSADTKAPFASIAEAAAARECTVIAKIGPDRIEYSAEGEDQWAKISAYDNPKPKDWSNAW